MGFSFILFRRHKNIISKISFVDYLVEQLKNDGLDNVHTETAMVGNITISYQ
jgi:hypothetical protein